jgi:hypothetical protein
MLDMADQFNTGEEIEQAVLEEREACAKVCDDMSGPIEIYNPAYIHYIGCAKAIRARGLDNLNKEAEKNGEEL